MPASGRPKRARNPARFRKAPTPAASSPPRRAIARATCATITTRARSSPALTKKRATATCAASRGSTASLRVAWASVRATRTSAPTSRRLPARRLRERAEGHGHGAENDEYRSERYRDRSRARVEDIEDPARLDRIHHSGDRPRRGARARAAEPACRPPRLAAVLRRQFARED